MCASGPNSPVIRWARTVYAIDVVYLTVHPILCLVFVVCSTSCYYRLFHVHFLTIFLYVLLNDALHCHTSHSLTTWSYDTPVYLSRFEVTESRISVLNTCITWTLEKRNKNHSRKLIVFLFCNQKKTHIRQMFK